MGRGVVQGGGADWDGLGRDGGWLPTDGEDLPPASNPKGDLWTLYKVERFMFMFMSRIGGAPFCPYYLLAVPRVYLVDINGY